MRKLYLTNLSETDISKKKMFYFLVIGLGMIMNLKKNSILKIMKYSTQKFLIKKKF